MDRKSARRKLLFGEGEELRRCHEAVACVLAEVEGVLVVVLQVVEAGAGGRVLQAAVGKHVSG